jgi:hypothetical protein
MPNSDDRLPDVTRETPERPDDKTLGEAIAAGPIVGVEQLVGVGCDEQGSAVQFAVKTATQGVVRLQMDLKTVCALIDSAIAVRGQAEDKAQKAGIKVPHSLTVISKYAIGDIPGVAGVIMTLNYELPNSQMFLIPTSNDAAAMGQGLIRQAGICRQMERIVGAPGGANGKRGLILPPGMQ